MGECPAWLLWYQGYLRGLCSAQYSSWYTLEILLMASHKELQPNHLLMSTERYRQPSRLYSTAVRLENNLWLGWLWSNPSLAPVHDYLGPAGEVIEVKESLKDIGVHLSSDLAFKLQVEKAVVAAASKLAAGVYGLLGEEVFQLWKLFGSHLCSQSLTISVRDQESTALRMSRDISYPKSNLSTTWITGRSFRSPKSIPRRGVGNATWWYFYGKYLRG